MSYSSNCAFVIARSYFYRNLFYACIHAPLCVGSCAAGGAEKPFSACVCLFARCRGPSLSTDQGGLARERTGDRSPSHVRRLLTCGGSHGNVRDDGMRAAPSGPYGRVRSFPVPRQCRQRDEHRSIPLATQCLMSLSRVPVLRSRCSQEGRSQCAGCLPVPVAAARDTQFETDGPSFARRWPSRRRIIGGQGVGARRAGRRTGARRARRNSARLGVHRGIC